MRAPARTLFAAVVAAATAGCGGSLTGVDGGDPAGSAACVYGMTYDGRDYWDVGQADFRTADRLGPAVEPPCDDTGPGGNDDPATGTTAYAVQGVDPAVAIAVGPTPEDARLVATGDLGADLPAEVTRLLVPGLPPGEGVG